ncbi:MAG TPA: M56 family metallopeptidase [Terracidiphilus sp.]|nr:M56 family metallopeptidase [Terracidiphilus sp.]
MAGLGAVASDRMLTFGWSLIHLLWQGGLVAIALAVGMRAARRLSARARYAIAWAALGSIVACFALTWFTLALGTMRPSTTVRVRNAFAQTYATEGISHLPIAHGLGVAVEWINFHMGEILLVWVVGAAFMLVQTLWSVYAVQQLHACAADVDSDEIRRKAEEGAVSAEIASPPKLKWSERLSAPAVVGWLRPTILLPAVSIEGLSERQERAILAHELAHIRRYDAWANLLQAVIEAVFFYHPAVFWISKQIRREREHCCDDCAVRAIGSALEYAKALVLLEERRSLTEVRFSIGVYGGDLSMRIKRLVEPVKPARAVRSIAAVLTLLGVSTVVAIVILSGSATRQVMAQTNIQAMQSKAGKAVGSSTSVKPDLDCTYYDADARSYEGVCEGSATDTRGSFCRQIDGAQLREQQSSCMWKLKRMREWKLLQEKSGK